MSDATVASALMILLVVAIVVPLALLAARWRLRRKIRELQTSLRIRQAALACIDQLEADRARLLAERDRLEAAIDRHRADYKERGWPALAPDAALYATLREIRDERTADAAPGGRGGETE